MDIMITEILETVRVECRDLTHLVYGGKTVVCFAIVDDLVDGYNLAQSLPGCCHRCDGVRMSLSVANARTQPLRGSDVFRPIQLPTFATFVYPEHTLTPYQQTLFMHVIIAQHAEVQTLIVITTSAVIVSDMVTASVRTIRNPTAREIVDAFLTS